MLTQLFTRKHIFARITQKHGTTLKDDRVIREVERRIGATRNEMIEKLSFIGGHEAARFVDAEIAQIRDDTKVKVDAMPGDLAKMRDKISDLPEAWGG